MPKIRLDTDHPLRIVLVSVLVTGTFNFAISFDGGDFKVSVVCVPVPRGAVRRDAYASCSFCALRLLAPAGPWEGRLKFRSATIQHHWSAHGLAVWDNRCTQHYAVADYWPHRRVNRRVTFDVPGTDRPNENVHRAVIAGTATAA